MLDAAVRGASRRFGNVGLVIYCEWLNGILNNCGHVGQSFAHFLLDSVGYCVALGALLRFAVKQKNAPVVY